LTNSALITFDEPSGPILASGLPRPAWLSDFEQVILQEPLIASRPSRTGFDRIRRTRVRPRTVFVGIGLCTPTALSRTLPIDVLGQLLPAEAIRRALGADRLRVLVADDHVDFDHFSPEAVRRRADTVVRSLIRIRARLGLDALEVARGSAVARDTDYQRVLREVEAEAGPHANRYAVRQTADVAYCEEQFGPIVKVGWVMSAHRHVGTNRDEAAFDRCVHAWSDARPAFVYVKAGRALDDQRKKAPPYIEVHPARRIRLHPQEQVHDKLATARVHRATLNGVKNQLRALTNTYARLVEPLRGTPADRAQLILRRLYAGRRSF
jgi:hypothetical protein